MNQTFCRWLTRAVIAILILGDPLSAQALTGVREGFARPALSLQTDSSFLIQTQAIPAQVAVSFRVLSEESRSRLTRLRLWRPLRTDESHFQQPAYATHSFLATVLLSSIALGRRWTLHSHESIWDWSLHSASAWVVAAFILQTISLAILEGMLARKSGEKGPVIYFDSRLSDQGILFPFRWHPYLMQKGHRWLLLPTALVWLPVLLLHEIPHWIWYRILEDHPAKSALWHYAPRTTKPYLKHEVLAYATQSGLILGLVYEWLERPWPSGLAAFATVGAAFALAWALKSPWKRQKWAQPATLLFLCCSLVSQLILGTISVRPATPTSVSARRDQTDITAQDGALDQIAGLYNSGITNRADLFLRILKLKRTVSRQEFWNMIHEMSVQSTANSLKKENKLLKEFRTHLRYYHKINPTLRVNRETLREIQPLDYATVRWAAQSALRVSDKDLRVDEMVSLIQTILTIETVNFDPLTLGTSGEEGLAQVKPWLIPDLEEGWDPNRLDLRGRRLGAYAGLTRTDHNVLGCALLLKELYRRLSQKHLDIPHVQRIKVILMSYNLGETLMRDLLDEYYSAIGHSEAEFKIEDFRNFLSRRYKSAAKSGNQRAENIIHAMFYSRATEKFWDFYHGSYLSREPMVEMIPLPAKKPSIVTGFRPNRAQRKPPPRWGFSTAA